MKKIFIFAAAALIFAACDSNEDNPAVSSEAAKIYATIGESAVSRAVDTTWNKGDRIGISSTVGDMAGPYINLEYTTKDGDGKFEGTDLFFYKPMTLTAYYPFTGDEGTAPGTNGLIEASVRPENQTAAKQTGFDFLWDSQTGFTAKNPYVNFTFAHKMSKVTFTFQSSDPVFDEETNVQLSEGVDVSTLVRYTISGLGLEGTFNTATGVCAPKPGVGPEDFVMNVSNVKNDVALTRSLSSLRRLKAAAPSSTSIPMN